MVKWLVQNELFVRVSKDSEKDMSKVYPVITVLRCLLTKSIHHLESHAEVGTIKSKVAKLLAQVWPKYSGIPKVAHFLFRQICQYPLNGPQGRPMGNQKKNSGVKTHWVFHKWPKKIHCCKLGAKSNTYICIAILGVTKRRF